MKNHRSDARRILSVLLCLWLSVALMPLQTFAEGELSAPDVAEAACTHAELEAYPAKAADCLHTGMKAYRQCKSCGAYFDAIELVEVDYQDLVTPVGNHKWVKTGEVPATASADGKITYTCSVCGATYDEETHYKPVPATAKTLTLDGNKLSFKSKVVKTVPSFMSNAKISHIWIKAAKKKITLSWELARNMKLVDGVIVLRKDGKSKTYKEVKRISFKTASGGTSKWTPKTSFADTTAKKKNTPYTYVIVSYFVEDGYTYISHCSEWAAGETTASKLKNAYKAKINKKSANLQAGGKVTLKASQSKPKKYYLPKSVRWYSDNTKVAKVTSKGVVKAVAPGRTTVRARLASGKDVTCKVTVVGAFKPAAPTLKIDTATNTSITLIWNTVKYATAYDVYRSDDGLHWKKPVRVTAATKKFTGLEKGHRYTFYVIAVNNNGKYSASSTNSNVVYQKAVIKRRTTEMTGWPTAKSIKAGSAYTVTVKITTPTARTAKLQMYNGSKWINMKSIKLPSGAAKASVKIAFPNDWWGDTTKWRLYIPQDISSTALTSKTLTISSARKYQNPSKYIQIVNTISKHGYGYYVAPMLVNPLSTKSDHIEALIKTARKYKGDNYINGYSGAPGQGIDASGLVIQACYSAGIDLWPISPSTRPSNCVPKLMDAKLATVKYTSDHVNMTRGDLLFFQTAKNYYGHVAIYLGEGRIIHASLATMKVETSTISALIKPVSEGGKYGYPESKIQVRRIFN